MQIINNSPLPRDRQTELLESWLGRFFLFHFVSESSVDSTRVKILMNRAFDGQHLITTAVCSRALAKELHFSRTSLIKRVQSASSRSLRFVGENHTTRKVITFFEFFEIRSTGSWRAPTGIGDGLRFLGNLLRRVEVRDVDCCTVWTLCNRSESTGGDLNFHPFGSVESTTRLGL